MGTTNGSKRRIKAFIMPKVTSKDHFKGFFEDDFATGFSASVAGTSSNGTSYKFSGDLDDGRKVSADAEASYKVKGVDISEEWASDGSLKATFGTKLPVDGASASLKVSLNPDGGSLKDAGKELKLNYNTKDFTAEAVYVTQVLDAYA